MKTRVGANDDRILGFAMIGPEAGEVAAVVWARPCAQEDRAIARAAIATVAAGYCVDAVLWKEAGVAVRDAPR